MRAMLRHIIASLGIVLCLCSCQNQQELSYDEAHKTRRTIEVVFDWSLHPDAEPATMSLYLFPDDGGAALRYEFANRNGGRISVPVGRYTAFAFNSDTENILPRNTGALHTFELYLRDAYEMQGLSVRSDFVPRAPGAENERITSAAESLWIARVPELNVEEGSDQSPITLALIPADAVYHYTVDITGVKNLAGVTSLSASLSGMAGSLFPHDGSVSDENVSITFGLEPSSDSSLSGRLHTFGHCGRSRTRTRADDDDEHVLHQLTVYAVLSDGSRWYHSYDVTEHIHSSMSEGTTSLTVDGLELPEAVAGSGGFNIDVGEWTQVSELLHM